MKRDLICSVTCFVMLGLGYFESSVCWYQPGVHCHHRGAAQPLNPKAVLCMKWSFCQQGWISVWACSLYTILSKCSGFKRTACCFFFLTSKTLKSLSVKGGILKRSNPANNQPGSQPLNASSSIYVLCFQHQTWPCAVRVTAELCRTNCSQFVADSNLMALCRKILICP